MPIFEEENLLSPSSPVVNIHLKQSSVTWVVGADSGWITLIWGCCFFDLRLLLLDSRLLLAAPWFVGTVVALIALWFGLTHSSKLCASYNPPWKSLQHWSILHVYFPRYSISLIFPGMSQWLFGCNENPRGGKISVMWTSQQKNVSQQTKLPPLFRESHSILLLLVRAPTVKIKSFNADAIVHLSDWLHTKVTG